MKGWEKYTMQILIKILAGGAMLTSDKIYLEQRKISGIHRGPTYSKMVNSLRRHSSPKFVCA